MFSEHNENVKYLCKFANNVLKYGRLDSFARLRIEVSGSTFEDNDEIKNEAGSEPQARQHRKNSRTARSDEFDSRRASVDDSSAGTTAQRRPMIS